MKDKKRQWQCINEKANEYVRKNADSLKKKKESGRENVPPLLSLIHLANLLCVFHHPVYASVSLQYRSPICFVNLTKRKSGFYHSTANTQGLICLKLWTDGNLKPRLYLVAYTDSGRPEDRVSHSCYTSLKSAWNLLPGHMRSWCIVM